MKYISRHLINILSITLLLALQACSDGTMEEAGEDLDEAASSAADAAEEAGDDISNAARDAANRLEDACEETTDSNC